MAIPVLRVRDLDVALGFYVERLGAVVAWRGDGYAALRCAGHLVHLSSHGGDGAFGTAVIIPVDDVDEVAARLAARGWRPPSGASPVEVGPIDQTWGTRELYVRDPDGSCLRFVAGLDDAQCA